MILSPNTLMLIKWLILVFSYHVLLQNNALKIESGIILIIFFPYIVSFKLLHRSPCEAWVKHLCINMKRSNPFETL